MEFTSAQRASGSACWRGIPLTLPAGLSLCPGKCPSSGASESRCSPTAGGPRGCYLPLSAWCAFLIIPLCATRYTWHLCVCVYVHVHSVCVCLCVCVCVSSASGNKLLWDHSQVCSWIRAMRNTFFSAKALVRSEVSEALLHTKKLGLWNY